MAADDDTRRTLTTGRVVFLVIAAAAPLAAMVGNVPLALLYGNGPGLPVAFVIAAAVLLCFAVGYAAMSRTVVNTGAFYTYVARGLGKPAGLGAAYVAVLSYTALTIGLAGSLGYYLGDATGAPWEVFTAVSIAVVGALGYRSADVSARILGFLMVAEFVILFAFDLAVVLAKGFHALPSASLDPGVVTGGSLGIGLMFAFTSFVGFESAALYGEETKNPEKAVPRATYISVSAIGVFYFLTSWIIVGAIGSGQVKNVVTTHKAAGKIGDVVLDQATYYLGDTGSSLMGLFLITSLLASMLAVHNASSRYLFALGRERVLPARLGSYHPQHLSPHLGSLTVTSVTAVVAGIYAVAGLDPLTTLATSMIGLSTLGIVLLQAGASVSVVAYFRKAQDADLLRTAVAPAIGALGLLVALVLAVANYRKLTDSRSPAVTLLPVLLLLAVVGGLVFARYLRTCRPAVFANLARSELRATPRTLPRLQAPTGVYCLVGAGPAGLVMARMLLAEGIAFDWFERHHDVGGIWDTDNPGSPMYESAHFISSRFTSGFYGYPMPESYPDYPTWRQVRDYVRGFAEHFGLYEHVILSTSVDAVTPTSQGWDVTTSDGATRTYAGVIACPGVTWHGQRPTWPGEADFAGEIRHSSSYTRGAEMAGRRVLVVGAGNSGVDIACDAARYADAAFLSVRRGYRFVPKHIGGIPTDALLAGLVEPPKGFAIPADPSAMVDALVGDLTRFGLPAPDHALLTSHPIMNSQVLHHLAHGDLLARPDIAHFTVAGVTFVDGTHERIDLVLAATGYTYGMPFLPAGLLTEKAGHPVLYLNVFDREHDGLAVLGFVEFADAAYKRFEEMAAMVVLDIHARETGGPLLAQWSALKASDDPDLRGGMTYVDSPRHASYVESATYQAYLAELRARFGLGNPSDADWASPALVAA